MAEYRIVATLDPSGVSDGKARVKQELAAIDTAATSTKRTLEQTFDSAALTTAIGTLIGRIEALDTTMGNVRNESAAIVRSNTTLSTSLDQLAEAGVRAGDGVKSHGAGAKDAASGNAQMEASVRRVLQAVDQEAAELARLNKLLAEARILHQQGAISAEQLAKVEALAAAGVDVHTHATGNNRIAQMEWMHVMRASTDAIMAGASPLQVLGFEMGRIVEAARNSGAAAGGFAKIMGGPYGLAISLAVVGLLNLGMSLVHLTNEHQEAIDKLKEEAHQTEVNREAHVAFAATLEGVTAALEKNKEAEKALTDQKRTAAEKALVDAIAAKLRLDGIRNETEALITQAHALYEVAKARAAGPGQRGELAALNLPEAFGQLDALQSRLADIDSRRAEAERQIAEAQSHVEVEIGDRDGAEQIKKKYDGPNGLIELARKRLLAEHAVTGEIAAQTRALANQRDAEVKAYEKSQREHKPKSDGVSRFRSREQAIGIAGRELEQQGLRVGENEQFGGVHSRHTFAQHGKFAIDVNFGKGITEADDPDLKERFEELALMYQARGFRVLWNGRIYEAGADGPGRLIPKKISQHRDHLHVEAPQSLVGQPTQSSYAAAAAAEFRRQQALQKAAARKAEQESDFVQGIVDEAAARGHEGQVDTLQAQIERRKAQFKRRFNRDMTEPETKKVTDALTEAQAREIANRFDIAYTKPLERLEALQGRTGLARDIANAQLEESARRYGAAGEKVNLLSDAENKQIETSMRQQDALKREAEILAGIRQPLQDYADRLAALNALLAKGQISHANYNNEVLKLGDTARKSLADMPGVDRGGTGKAYADVAARGDEDARYAQEQVTFENNKQQLLQLGINYDSLMEAAHRRHVLKMAEIDRQRRDQQLGSAEDIFTSLTSIAEAGFGKQSGVYKAMFAVEKAIAIARAIVAIQTGIAEASANPFPYNLAAMASVAAATASIIANIQAVKLSFAGGGYVSGAGGSREDRVNARVSNGEFIVQSAAVARPGNRELLEAINNGAVMAGTRRAANDNRTSSSRGGDSWQLNFGDVNVHMPPGTSPTDGEAVGRQVREELRGLVRAEIADAKRNGGALTHTKPSVMAG